MTSELSVTHSFDIRLACEVGVEKAILIGYFQYWISENEKRNSPSHFRQGEYWTYSTGSDLAKKYPYLKIPSIYRWLDQLEAEEWIKTGRFNQKQTDQTKWYGRGKRLIEWLSNSIYQNDKSESIDPIYQNDNSIYQNDRTISQNDNCNYQNDNAISQNDKCNIKDTVINPVQTTVINPLPAARPPEEIYLAEEKKKEEAPAPPTPSPPPVSSPPKPIPIPAGKVYGDGVLQAEVVAYYRDNPDQFPRSIYLPFLAWWSKKKQKGDIALIGSEMWRTVDWDIATRLDKWNTSQYEKNQPNGSTTTDFLARQRAAEPQTIDDYGDF